MNKTEKEILKKVVEHHNGLISPADLINGIAKKDNRSVQNLIVKGYIEEVEQDHQGLPGQGVYKIKFYRATENGLIKFSSLKNRFWHNIKTQIALYVGISSIILGILTIVVSSYIAFAVPEKQKNSNQQDEIQAIYKNLVTNSDIYVSNSNNARYLVSSTKVADLPELYLEINISDSGKRILQDSFGLMPYRFFLYYVQQTSLMNQEITELKKSYIEAGVKSKDFQTARDSYLSSVQYLSLEKLNTKMSYGQDSECLQYFFEHYFSFIKPDGRGKVIECSNDSLNRLFYHFGFLPDDTPGWLMPKLKEALNEREPGLGDKVISDWEGKK